MKRNGVLWGHNSARDNSVADKSTLIEHVSGCRRLGNFDFTSLSEKLSKVNC